MKIFTWVTGGLGLLLAAVGVYFQWKGGGNSDGGTTTVLPITPASVGQPNAITPAPSTTPAPAATTPAPAPTPKKPKPRKDRFAATTMEHRNNL